MTALRCLSRSTERTTIARRTGVVALFVAALVLLGCPPQAAAPVSAACTKLGEKCKTPAGPLGVCDSVACGAGVAGPCFICMPQH